MVFRQVAQASAGILKTDVKDDMKGWDGCVLKVFLLLREDLRSHSQPATSVYLSKSMASVPWKAFPDSIVYSENLPSSLALVK